MMQDFTHCSIYRLKNVSLKQGKPMKTLKRLFQLLSICIVALGFYACKNETPIYFPPDDDKTSTVVWDIYPINLHFTVTGENGEDLLNPSTPGNYYGLNITATYQEKTYEIDVFEDNWLPKGRASAPPKMYGIYTSQQNDGRYALVFGEINGGEKFENATIILDWGNSTQDIITFSSSVTWKGDEPNITRTFKVNGETVAENTSNPVINIKKKAIQSPNKELAMSISPIVFNIYLTDTLGGNMLTKSKERYADRDSIKAIFRGKEYYINIKPDNSKENSTLSSDFTGLTLANYPQTMSPHPLKFGELDGTETFENENLIMDWGSLGRDTITFTSKIEWVDNRPTFIRRYALNGKEVSKDYSRPYIRIRK